MVELYWHCVWKCSLHLFSIFGALIFSTKYSLYVHSARRGSFFNLSRIFTSQSAQTYTHSFSKYIKTFMETLFRRIPLRPSQSKKYHFLFFHSFYHYSHTNRFTCKTLLRFLDALFTAVMGWKRGNFLWKSTR